MDAASQTMLDSQSGMLKKIGMKPKTKKPKKKAVAKKKPKCKAKPAGAVVRTERLDMRLSKAEKAKVVAKSKKTGLSITKLVHAAITKL